MRTWRSVLPEVEVAMTVDGAMEEDPTLVQ